MANEKFITVGTPGGLTNYKLVYSEVAFDANGDATVTAASLGVDRIKGFTAGVWGGTTDAVASIYAKTAFAAAGVTSIALEARESDAGTDADLNVTTSVVFICE